MDHNPFDGEDTLGDLSQLYFFLSQRHIIWDKIEGRLLIHATLRS